MPTATSTGGGHGAVGQRGEGGVQGGVRLGAERVVVDRQVAQPLEPVVGGAVERHHVDLGLEQRDERQEAIAVEAVLVEPVGRPVGGRDHGQAALEQALEQPAQDHGVGDVDDVELVEAEQAIALGDVGGQDLQRVLGRPGLAQLVQAALHLEHELVEVDAPMRHAPQAVGEQVHQHGLAAADAAMEVDAPRRRHRLPARGRSPGGRGGRRHWRAAPVPPRARGRAGRGARPRPPAAGSRRISPCAIRER